MDTVNSGKVYAQRAIGIAAKADIAIGSLAALGIKKLIYPSAAGAAAILFLVFVFRRAKIAVLVKII